jgi:hypothetical protein
MKTKTIISTLLILFVYNAKSQDIGSIQYFDTIAYIYIPTTPMCMPWGGYGIDIIEGNGANDMWYGQPNTDAIVSQLGDNGGVAYPALVCDTLTVFGFTDWYFPAEFETEVIKSYYLQVDSGWSTINSCGYLLWSSTEKDNNRALCQLTNNGPLEYVATAKPKNMSYNFTCIRREIVSNVNLESKDEVFLVNYNNHIKNLKITINELTETSVIEIYDISGRLVLHKEISPKTGEYTEIINTSGFAKSTYIVHVWSGKQSKTEKFIIE